MPNLRIAELDFDTIKRNLKTFLKSQTEFTDYNFEGSALSVLLDVLAYNTHYNAYLANMLMNEMFLDSAVKRTSAVSIAKHIGYTTRSVLSARAFLDITINNPTNNPTSIVLPKYTTFQSNINDLSLNFLNIEPYVIYNVNGVYTIENVQVYEGQLIEYSYAVNSPGPAEKYTIPDENVDLTTLKVTVRSNNIDQVYTFFDNLSTVKFDSKVYYVEESPTGRYQIFFGDGIFGKKLLSNDLVILEYLISNGELANTATNLSQQFVLIGTIQGNTNVVVSTRSNSMGGTAKESIDEIKFNAPYKYLAQNRAITSDDYKALILNNYPSVQSVAAWGGEENNPPEYGKVFISLKPFRDYIISDSTKNTIRNTVLKNKKSMGILVEFVDPEYIYLNLDIIVNYVLQNTILTENNIIENTTNLVRNFVSLNLEKFGLDFFVSKLSSEIDDSLSAIVGTNIKVGLQKRLAIFLNVINSYTGISNIKFYNRIKPTGVSSTQFFINYSRNTIPVYFTDIPTNMPPNPLGTGTLVLRNANTNTIVISNFGSLDYGSGEINIFPFLPVGFPSGMKDLRINVDLQEESYNVFAERSQVLVLDDSALNPLNNMKQGLRVRTNTILL